MELEMNSSSTSADCNEAVISNDSSSNISLPFRLKFRYEEDPYDFNGTVAWTCAIFAAFYYMNVTFKNKYNQRFNSDEFGARICSLIHAVFSTFGCMYACVDATNHYFDVLPSTRICSYFQAFTFAYFAADTVMMILGKFDLVFTLHHLVALASCYFPVFQGTHGFLICFATVFGEMSNIFMHSRWLLFATGHSNKAFTKILSRVFLVVFFLTRFLVGFFIVYHLYMNLPVYYAPACGGILIGTTSFFIGACRNPDSFDGVDAFVDGVSKLESENKDK